LVRFAEKVARALRLNTKQVAVCACFGGLAFTLRAVNWVIPIGGPFVIDLRGLPGVVGAAVSGPVGGLIVGVLAGFPAALPIVDVPSFALAYFLVGFFARVLSKFKWLSGLAVLVGYPVAAFIVWRLGLVPSFVTAFLLVIPRALVVVPLQLILLAAIFARWPNIVDLVDGKIARTPLKNLRAFILFKRVKFKTPYF